MHDPAGEARAADRLADLLRSAYSGERAAALVYRWHARSVRSAAERAEIAAIEGQEWHHRSCVGGMLERMGRAPSASRERRAALIGRTLGPLCMVTGWLAPMFGAGLLERRNIVEYEVAARLAPLAGHPEFVDGLLAMAEVEWDHERYFRGKVLSHPLGRRLPLWSPPPPRPEIRASFARETGAVPATARVGPVSAAAG